MKTIKLNPQFEDLEQPETFIDHIKDLTNGKSTPHTEILSKLLKQFEPLDFMELANPKNV